MASNDQTAAPAAGTQTSNVNLRIIALAHSTSQNEDVNLVLDLEANVAQLKEELQQRLSQHPRPETQRLIYQGRPLTDGNATLRQILRLESLNTGNQPPHVLHLVIRDDPSSTPAQPRTPNSTQSQSTPANPNLDSQRAPNPVASAFNLTQHAFPQGHPAQAMLQHAMQHQMALQNHHAQLQNMHPSPVPASMFNIPHINHTPNQPLPEQRDGQVPPSIPNAGTTGDDSTTSNVASNISQTSMSMSIEETIGPNGERIRRVVHHGPSPPGQVPVERSASAPGAGARSARSQTPVRSGLSHPPMLPGTPWGPLANLQQPFGNRMPITLPAPMAMPMAMPIGNAGLGSVHHTAQARDPLLYLVSSPNGPEAILFTPNHGYFTSSQTPSVPQPVTETQGNSAQAASAPPQPTSTQPAQQNAVAQNNQPGQVALRPQVPAQGQIQAQAARREGEDIIAQVLQRGWLFIRLYMFIFVLSEPGTWRRYIMLLVASLVCLLPRNNPITDLLQAARRHFDNLIGPPQVPPRPQGTQPQGQQPVGNTANDDGRPTATPNPEALPRHRSTDARMPTPEEHARRLLRESQNRHPNALRDALYRIEQAVALFLASLVPGVGERHVRAREEARRLMQEGTENRRREEEERLQAQNTEATPKTDEAPATSSHHPPSNNDSTAGSSTGVDTTGTHTTSVSTSDEGLRARGGDAGIQGL